MNKKPVKPYEPLKPFIRETRGFWHRNWPIWVALLVGLLGIGMILAIEFQRYNNRDVSVRVIQKKSFQK